MKDNPVKPLFGLCGLLLASLLTPDAMAEAARAAVTDTSAEALGLSDYRHFVIYPHLEKALTAQKNNDEKTALREFEYIHRQLPDNVPLTLYLAEAYRHFGHDDRARRLLAAQLKTTDDPRLRTSLQAIPVRTKPIGTVEELLARQQSCDAAPSAQCRSEVGQSALRLEQLAIARQQLDDKTFAAASEGKALREDLLQRAIYLKQWPLAENLLSQTPAQNATRRQWFDVLIAGRMDDRMLALQSQGIFSDPQSKLAYATSLAERGETARLQRYLRASQPAFPTAEGEKGWLYLLSRYSAQPKQALAQYPVRFTDNRRYQAGVAVPGLLQTGDYAAARAMLNQLPADEMLDERYAVSLATQNRAEAVRLARELYRRNPADLRRLDQLTWQLMQAGDSREATGLLLQRYPFHGDPRTASLLMLRLSGLLQAHPDQATPTQMARLTQPLSSAGQREWQSRLPGVADDCQAVRRLLGDMSSTYDAAAWNQLAQCYRDDLPGLALYASQQAERRQPDTWHHRSVAFQAFQVQDYATALQAWEKVPPHEMENADLLAAANTAQAAGDSEARDRWLQEEQKRGLDNTAHYWWLHAQRYLPGQPQLARDDLTRAIAIAPTASAYAARAAVYQQLGNPSAAVSDLRSALAMEPENSATQAALGYALWDDGDAAQARAMLEKAHKTLPDDPQIIRQLTYINQRLDDVAQTQYYARQVIDDLDSQAQAAPLSAEQNQQQYDFRRLHEDIARRWSVNFDTSLGLRSGAMSSANNNIGGPAPGESYRSYTQLEAEYRIGSNMLLDGDRLSAYSRLFADTGDSGVMLPVKNPMSGTGLRWKPLRDSVLFLAVEQQFPLDRHHGESDTMLRASASFLNSGKYSDEWHPNGQGWFAQNLYLDAAHYIRQDIQAWTADYRAGWHQKIAHGQTIEPYARIQANGYRDNETQGAQTAGIGVRWNIWSGETHYNAWPHKVSVGVEYQRTINTINQSGGDRSNAFLTLGVHW